MNSSDKITHFRRSTLIGAWLSRHRVWGMLLLLVLGLVFRSHSLSVRSGIPMMIAGGIGILAGTLLRIICSTFIPADNGRSPLVTDGPFAITRNPVLLSEAAIALGIAMMSRMPWLVLITLVMMILTSAPMVEWQEDTLRRTEPDAYAAYARLVPRWFSFRNFFDSGTYLKSRHRVPLLTAVRRESLTMLIALVAILAFLAKANVEALL